MSATPRPQLQMTGTLSWIGARFDRYVTKTGPTAPEIDLAGNCLTHVPDWSGSTSLAYLVDMAGRGTLSLRADATWQTRVFYSAFNDRLESQGAYGLMRLRGAFEPPSGRWELALLMQNVTNRPYVTGTNVVGLSPVIAGRPGEPRRWSTQFTVRY